MVNLAKGQLLFTKLIWHAKMNVGHNNVGVKY